MHRDHQVVGIVSKYNLSDKWVLQVWLLRTLPPLQSRVPGLQHSPWQQALLPERALSQPPGRLPLRVPLGQMPPPFYRMPSRVQGSGPIRQI